MSEPKDIELEEIRHLTLSALKNFKEGTSETGSLQPVTLIIEVGKESVRQGLAKAPSSGRYDHFLSDKEHASVREIITNFFAEGILMWGSNRNNPESPFMGITEYGSKVLEADQVIPHDMYGFISKFKEEAPKANKLVIKYLTESLQTYRHNHMLSSSVMLGVSSEAAFNELFDELKKSISDPRRLEKFEKLEKSTSLKDRFDETMKEVNKFKPLLDGKLREDIESHVNGIFELIRNQRNDSSHPTGKDVSRDDMLINLRLFIMYCKSLYKVVKWLKKNPAWEGKLSN